MHANRRFHWTWLLPLLAVACGGGGPTPGGDPGPLPDGIVQDVPATDATDEGGRPDLSDVPAAHRYQIILAHDPAYPLSTLIEQSVQFSATVIDYGNGSVAVGLPVAFEVVAIHDLDGNVEDDGDGRLEFASTTTDDNGRLYNRFFGETTADRIYTVEISVPDTDTEPVRFDVRVTAAACGCIEVDFLYEGQQEATSLHDLVVSVVPSDFKCGQHLKPTTTLDDELVIADRLVPDLSSTVRFDCIPAGANYSVFAKARGAVDMCVAASGCDRTLVLEPNSCDKVTLTFYDAMLSPSGLYESTDHFDFSALIEECAGGDTTIVGCATSAGDVGKTICCALAELNKFFANPGLTIIETLQSLVAYWFGQLAADVIDLFKDAIATVVTDYLKNRSPEWLADFFTVGESMMDVINYLELHSDLQLLKPQLYTVTGAHFYKELWLYWKIGCDPSAPDFADCGRIILSMEDLQNAQIPTNIIGGEFSATISNFNRLMVHEHEVGLHYGKLVLYVLNEIIIASITDGKAHSLIEVAHLWLDCNQLAKDIADITGGILGSNTEQQIEDMCNAGVDGLFGFVDDYLGALTLGSSLVLRGSATLVDDNCDADLKVDRLISGTWDGNLQGSSQQAAVTGTWEAALK
jgi:hypothetical protein